MSKFTYWLVTVLLFVAGTTPTFAMTETVYAVTAESNLISFQVPPPPARASQVTSHGAITGLQPTEKIVEIDFRPATGELYGLGSTTRLYKIDLVTAAASQMGTSTFDAGTSTEFGMDFDPVADTLRVVTNEDHNLVLDPDGVEEPLAGPALAPASELSDVGYTNSYPGSTTTTLYGLDTETDSLVTISAGGEVSTVTTLKFGGTENIHPGSSLDIHGGVLYGMLRTNHDPLIYTINPSDGNLTILAPVESAPAMVSIAVRPDSLIQPGKKGPVPPKVAIRLNFAKPGADSIAVRGVLRVPEGFSTTGQEVTVDVGGVTRTFMLDAKGKAKSDFESFSLKVKTSKVNGMPAVLEQAAKFSFALKKGSFAAELAEEDLVNATVSGSEVELPVSVHLNQHLYQDRVTLTYKAKAGKKGSAK